MKNQIKIRKDKNQSRKKHQRGKIARKKERIHHNRKRDAAHKNQIEIKMTVVKLKPWINILIRQRQS